MKKVYLGFLAFGIAATATAQENSTKRAPQQADPHLEITQGKPAISSNNQQKNLNILWTEDFSGGTNPLETGQGQWAVEGPDGAYWDINSDPHPLPATGGWVSQMNAEHAEWDSWGPIDEPPGSFATTSVLGALVSPSIALTGNTNSIGISFITETMYCCNFNEDIRPFGVSISTDDGTTWSDTVRFDFGIDRNEPTADIINPLQVAVNLDAIAPPGPQATFRFKFVWDGDSPDGNGQYNSHYFWLIDDVSIYEIPSNDIALLQGYHNDIIFDYEYSHLTVEQSTAREMVPVLMVENQGVDPQTLDFTVEITDGGGTVVNTTVINETILSGQMDTLYFQTGYQPSAADTYGTRFFIAADDDPSDDELTASDLIVNANLMAHDYGAVQNYGWDPAGNNSDLADAPHSFGNVYIPSANQDVYGLDVAFGPDMSDGLFLLARIQEMTGTSIQDPLNPVVEIDHTTAAGEEGTVVTIVFAQPATLVAGTPYIVDIYKVDGTTGQEFDIAGSQAMGEDDDFASANFGPYGTGGAINYWTGWGYASYVRPNFDMSLSVDENATLEGVSVYPNPSEGIINISNDNNLEHTIEVRNLAGQLISTTTVSNATTIDLSNEAAGVYVVKVSNENGAIAEKVTVK